MYLKKMFIEQILKSKQFDFVNYYFSIFVIWFQFLPDLDCNVPDLFSEEADCTFLAFSIFECYPVSSTETWPYRCNSFKIKVRKGKRIPSILQHFLCGHISKQTQLIGVTFRKVAIIKTINKSCHWSSQWRRSI